MQSAMTNVNGHGSLHRRKSSAEMDIDQLKKSDNGSPLAPRAIDDSVVQSRTRISSAPSQTSTAMPPSSPSFPPSPSNLFRPGLALNVPIGPQSPFRASFGHGHNRSHSRNNSISSSPSPLALNFPMGANSHLHTHGQGHGRTNSMSMPKPVNGTIDENEPISINDTSPTNDQPLASNTAQASRRHQRLHSRNLSVFFPRPGSTPHTISEDYDPSATEAGPVPETVIPRANSNPTNHRAQLQGFSFGGRPGSTPRDLKKSDVDQPAASATRRGHHHKHSMSHQFYSFLEPGGSGEIDLKHLHTAPTPTLQSPWAPVSAFPTTTPGIAALKPGLDAKAGFSVPAELPVHQQPFAFPVSIIVFLLGSTLWVMGQQAGSLSTTGLGYWVVFDAMGVAIAGILPAWMALSTGGKKRMYGNARVESVILFAQSVYLMFASVYVCKETVEHLLLSTGASSHAEGHHHHAGDEGGTVITGVTFPIFCIFMTLFTLTGTSVMFKNHARLVNTTNTQMAPVQTVIRDTISRVRHSSTHNAKVSHLHDEPASASEWLIRNPFTLWPTLFSISILLAVALLPTAQFRAFDLALAAVQTVVTFNVSYRACVSLGTVLLQTAPQRGLAGGRMEAFLRAMRDLERHPQVLHLPAPHIWQLTPSLTSSGRNTAEAKVALVVTLELHVKPELADDDVLELTRWAWERCVSALHFGVGNAVVEGRAEAEVTVGVVRG